MPRRYRRRRSYKLSKPVKYSSETYAAGALTAWQSNTAYTSVLISGTNVLGTRKAKNFTLTINLKPDPTVAADQNLPMYFALVYVPEGTQPQSPKIGSTLNQGVLQALSFYEPNQNVIIQGFVDDKQIYRYKSRLARNLNAGDTIMLVWAPLSNYTNQALFTFTLNYALAF